MEELSSEAAQHLGGERVGYVGRGLELHLGVGQVEDQVLPLVTDVVLLEPEKEAKPVHQVIVRVPLQERGFPEVTCGA